MEYYITLQGMEILICNICKSQKYYVKQKKANTGNCEGFHLYEILEKTTS